MALAIPGVLALWTSNLGITGSLTWDTGAQPTTQTCSITFSGTGDDNLTQTCNWTNDDGTVSMEFVCDSSNITSTDSKCNYENGKDLKLWLAEDGATFSPCESTPSYSMESGTNTITIKAEPHPTRCPLSGQVTIDGTIV